MLYWPKLDDSAKNIVAYVVSNGPVTMYRVARDLNIHFSHAYRKARKLEQMGFLTSTGGPRASLYDASIKGLLYTYSTKMASLDITLSKLREALGLRMFSLEEVNAFIKFFLSLADRDAPVTSIATMVSYILDKCGSEYVGCMSVLDHRDRVLASRVVAYGIINMIHRFFGDAVVIADEGYFALVNLRNGSLMAVQCRLCGREKYCSLDPCPSLQRVIETRLRNVGKITLTF